MKIKELLKLLGSQGWQISRIRGSHRQLKHTKYSGTVTVAGKLSADVPKGTLHTILKQAGLKRKG